MHRNVIGEGPDIGTRLGVAVGCDPCFHTLLGDDAGDIDLPVFADLGLLFGCQRDTQNLLDIIARDFRVSPIDG